MVAPVATWTVEVWSNSSVTVRVKLPQPAAVRWLDVQRRGWETGERLSFAVHKDRVGSGESRPVAGVGEIWNGIRR